jgi:hypothetical protein
LPVRAAGEPPAFFADLLDMYAVRLDNDERNLISLSDFNENKFIEFEVCAEKNTWGWCRGGSGDGCPTGEAIVFLHRSGSP